MYTPDPNVGDAALQRELEKIEAQFRSCSFAGLILDVLYVEPGRPREGLVVFADGTSWNPGAGAGVYAYYSGAWNKL